MTVKSGNLKDPRTYNETWMTSGTFSMLTSSKVFIGGSKEPFRLPGSSSKNNFVGCLRNVSTKCKLFSILIRRCITVINEISLRNMNIRIFLGWVQCGQLTSTTFEISKGQQPFDWFRWFHCVRVSASKANYSHCFYVPRCVHCKFPRFK